MASAGDDTLSRGVVKMQMFNICRDMKTVPNSREFCRSALPALQKKGVRWIQFSDADCADQLHVIFNNFTELEGIKVCAVPNLTGYKFIEFANTEAYKTKMKIFLCFEQEIRHFRLFSLTYLILDGVRNFKKEVNSIVRHTPNVKTLHVRLTETGLDDTDMAEIIGSLKNLENLNLKHCRPVQFRLGNASYYRSESLKRLWLTRCRDLNDNSVQTISHAFPNLRQFEVVGCSGVSDECFEYLDHMKKLECVSIGDCRNITKTGSETFMKATNVAVNTDKRKIVNDTIQCLPSVRANRAPKRVPNDQSKCGHRGAGTSKKKGPLKIRK